MDINALRAGKFYETVRGPAEVQDLHGEEPRRVRVKLHSENGRVVYMAPGDITRELSASEVEAIEGPPAGGTLEQGEAAGSSPIDHIPDERDARDDAQRPQHERRTGMPVGNRPIVKAPATTATTMGYGAEGSKPVTAEGRVPTQKEKEEQQAQADKRSARAASIDPNAVEQKAGPGRPADSSKKAAAEAAVEGDEKGTGKAGDSKHTGKR